MTNFTKRLLTDFDALYGILNHLTGEQIYTHQIPSALLATSQYVQEVYPQLAEVTLVDGQIQNEEDAKRFVTAQKAKYGESLPLAPMPKDMYDCMDPIEEAIQMRGR